MQVLLDLVDYSQVVLDEVLEQAVLVKVVPALGVPAGARGLVPRHLPEPEDQVTKN